jgi:hypothetical protein
MKKLFIVVSSIETNNHYPFNFGETRSSFNNEERFRQTLFTLQSLRCWYPNDGIIVLDTSHQISQEYIDQIGYFGATYVPFKEIDAEEHKIVTTHPSINLCECTLLSSFFKKQKSFLNQFDYIIKCTARYTYSQFDDLFNRENVNKFFFKKPIPFEWSDGWRYEMIDRRNIQGNNLLYQYSTVLYAFGISNLNRMIDIYDAHNHIVEMTLPFNINYDIESLSFFLTRPFEKDIVETNWKIMGFEGVHGKLMYY